MVGSRTTRSLLRGLMFAGGLIAAAASDSVIPFAQSPSDCVVGGTITAAGRRLPGVVVSLARDDGTIVVSTATGLDGVYALNIPRDSGTVTLRASLVAFAAFAKTFDSAISPCGVREDITLTLASRVARTAESGPPSPGPPANAEVRATAPRSGRIGGGPTRSQPAAQAFQSLPLVADEGGSQGGDETGSSAGNDAQSVLPPGFSPNSSSESVTSIGGTQNAVGFFGLNGPETFADRFGTGFGAPDGFAGQGAQGLPGAQGGPGERGGPGGFGREGGFAPGGPAFGRGDGRGNQRIRGSAYQSVDWSGLDAAPYALNAQQSVKPAYLQQRFGATLGGPLVIGKWLDSPRTFFFANYTGNHSSNPYDAYATVPTLAERSGDLSSLRAAIIDPTTGAAFAGNQIPAARLNPAAVALLDLFPAPNQTDPRQNLHTVGTTNSNLDDVNVRFVHLFGAPPTRAGGGAPGRTPGGRGGSGGGRAGGANLNVSIHYRHSDSTLSNPIPSLGGTSTTSAWDIPVNGSFSKAGLTHQLRFDFNRQRTQTSNLFASLTDIAGNAGILGISTDPFDYGAPNLSFSSITSVRDTNPSLRTDRTLSLGDTVIKTHGAQTLRFGGDYRDIHADSRTDSNARGSFVFTGLYSGSDLSDFLLGLPQQSSVQYGPGLEQFRSRSADLFAQDDWRVSDTVTLNAGLRYEYFSPVSEAANRLATLDAAPDFTAVVPVTAGGTGPYSGAFPDTIVHPFRTGFAPRLGVAFRPKPGTVLRGGYSITYNAAVYQTIAQQLAGQPPFASSDTVLGSLATPIPLEQALLFTQSATTNSYAVDPNYRLPRAQTWNLDVQRDLTRTIQLGIGYVGTKGSNLDILRAPNRTASGLLLADVAPFIWESSEGNSILHSLTVRLRKRMSAGFGFGGTYTLSRSIDDASSIAGSGGTVAQNDLDLAAERGLSSFDQRHRFAADFMYELPFGADKRWFNGGGLTSSLFGNWQVNGNAQFASGTPFTARVLSNIQDVARGTNGTLRANYNGSPIAIADPTALLFFNTAAFSIPAAGAYGNAGRNTIIGPGTSVVNLGVMRNFLFAQTRAVTLQLTASNVFNTVQYAAIDTIVNSPTFGQVTAVRPMRRILFQTRFRF